MSEVTVNITSETVERFLQIVLEDNNKLTAQVKELSGKLDNQTADRIEQLEMKCDKYRKALEQIRAMYPTCTVAERVLYD